MNNANSTCPQMAVLCLNEVFAIVLCSAIYLKNIAILCQFLEAATVCTTLNHPKKNAPLRHQNKTQLIV